MEFRRKKKNLKEDKSLSDDQENPKIRLMKMIKTIQGLRMKFKKQIETLKTTS